MVQCVNFCYFVSLVCCYMDGLLLHSQDLFQWVPALFGGLVIVVGGMMIILSVDVGVLYAFHVVVIVVGVGLHRASLLGILVG